MERLLFGPAGVPESSVDKSTAGGIERIAELGLGCMEMEFVQGVKMGEATAISIGKLGKQKGVALSAHGPYFINLNAREPEKIVASKQRIMQTARIAYLCGAKSIVFHAAFYLGDSPAEVYNTVKKHLREIATELRSENNHVWIRPEVTGKSSQFGTLDEVLRLSSEIEGVAPCIDFAHWHARNNKFNSYSEFMTILQKIEWELGRQALEEMHIHVSGVAYGKKGENKHLDLKDSDFNYMEFIKALIDYGAKGLVIAESPNLEDDALLLQRTYQGATSSH